MWMTHTRREDELKIRALVMRKREAVDFFGNIST
jgi:hypothetical protein